MDRDTTIIVNILKAAKVGTLSKRQWLKYGCRSEDEMQKFLDVLIGTESIVEHKQPNNAATDGHGRVLIEFENDPIYSITELGEKALEGLEKSE